MRAYCAGTYGVLAVYRPACTAQPGRRSARTSVSPLSLAEDRPVSSVLAAGQPSCPAAASFSPGLTVVLQAESRG